MNSNSKKTQFSPSDAHYHIKIAVNCQKLRFRTKIFKFVAFYARLFISLMLNYITNKIQ